MPEAKILRPHSTIPVDLILISVTLIWGMNFSVMKGLFDYFDPLAFTALRFVTVVVTMALVMRLRGYPLGIDIQDLPLISWLGILSNTIYQILFVHGLANTKAGNAGLFMALTPVFAYLTGTALKRERFSLKVMSGIFLSFLGVVGIILYGSKTVALGAYWQGDLLVILSAACWGAYTGSASRMIRKYGALRLTFWVMLTGTVFLIPVLAKPALRQDWLSIPVSAWFAFSYSTFLSIIYCYIAWSYAIERVGVSRTAVYSNVTPLIALLGGWIMLAEHPAFAQFLGIILILSGVFIVRSQKTILSTAEFQLLGRETKSSLGAGFPPRDSE